MEESKGYYWFWVVMVLYLGFVCVKKMMEHLWWTPKRVEKMFAEQGIRGPPYQFFIGNLKEIVSLSNCSKSHPPFSHNILPTVLSFYHHWKKIYGATFLVWFGPTARVTIADPVLIREIFCSKIEMFEKSESPPLVKKLEGDGLLTLHGHKWALHRKIITPTFHLENLKLMIPTLGKTMENMLEKWSAMSNSGEVEIEVSKWFQSLSEEAIAHTAFGSSYEDGRRIFQLQAQLEDFASKSYQQIFVPGYRFLPTKTNRMSRRLNNEIIKSLTELIDKRMKNSCEHVISDECPNDLLGLMIRASVQNTTLNSQSSPPSPPSTITVQDIIEECKTIFFAGKQTMTNLLTWTTILLAMHPQWQDLAREEVRKVCGSHNIPTKDDIAKLKTLSMILNESLRLYPPVVATIRRAKMNVNLGGCLIPSGTEILIPIVAVHHDHKIWGNDATEFNPARFTSGVAQAATHPMAFMPFGLGTRRCVGQNLAMLQVKLAITMILQRFSFDLAPSYRHTPTVLMLLHPKFGAPITFHKLCADATTDFS